MISSKNKKSFSNDFIGKINEKNINNCFDIKNFNIQNELYNFFPIDIKSNQRFVLEKNQRKIPLIISFDFNDNFNKEKKNEFSTNLNNEYSNSLFEIELNAFLHEDNKIHIFKDNINFKVKGFDIMKSIHNKPSFSKPSTSILRKSVDVPKRTNSLHILVIVSILIFIFLGLNIP